MADTETTGPQELSLDRAAERIQSLLSGASSGASEDKRTPTSSQPEQSSVPSETAEQAPAAPETEESAGSEQATEDASTTEDTEQPDAPPPPRMFKVKVDGQEIEVPEDEVVKGYSRTADYTRKTQELAQARREFEEKELAAVRAERQQYADTLPKLIDWMKASSPPEPTLATAASPEAFAVEWTQWKQHQDQLARITAERERMQAIQDREAEAGFRQYVQAEQAKLIEAIPAFNDPDKSVALKRDLGEYAKSRGFTDEDLSKVTDHRLVILLHDAMQGHKQATAAKAKAPEIKNKIENALAPSQPGSKANAPPKNKLTELKQRLKQTGKQEDAGAAINALLGVG